MDTVYTHVSPLSSAAGHCCQNHIDILALQMLYVLDTSRAYAENHTNVAEETMS
jgi:hypothetical protein